MLISVILPTYNNEKTISDSIRSILNQSYRKFELIIINDCSTDKTKEIINTFDDSRIVYIENNQNLGRSRSRNKAIEIAKGEFIAVMDGDDISIPTRVDIQLKYLNDNPNIDLVASNIIFFTNNNVKGVSNVKLNELKNINFFFRPIGLPHVTWMCRKNFFLNFKYNSNIPATIDQDLLLRSFKSNNYFLINEPLVFVNEPKSYAIKYKLKQVYILFRARMKFIINDSSFHFIPIIFLVFLISCIFYAFGLRTNKIITSHNLYYQKILNKLLSKEPYN